MSDCWKYNLTENVRNCYLENPLAIIEDNWFGICVFVAIVAIVWYLYNKEESEQ